LANFQETSNAKKGGLFVGKSHAEGGIPAVVTDTGRPIEVEGGEAIINKEATAKHWKELSKINQSAGNGVPIPPPYEFSEKINEKMERGGKLTLKEKSLIYTKWRRLINMTARELEKYYDSPDGKTSGLTQKEADKQGIDSGRESARMIVKMKRTRKDFWTNDMWRWAKKQISFVSRMRGVKGDLYDEKRKKTRKLKALLIWGHNPKKYRGSDLDFKEGGVAEKFFEDEVGHPFNKEDKKIDRPFTIRFHLGAGENFMKWKVENTDSKEVNFYQPDQYQIFMFDCKLVNSPKTAQKIFTGEINKTPIAWVQCARVEVMPISEQVIDIDKLSYNPQKAPNWIDVDGDILDNYVFPELVTFNRGVYYFEGEEIYEVGGLTYKEKFNKKYGFDPDESHSLKEVGKLTRIKEDSLQDIFDKGVGAYKTNPESVRPSVKTPEQWAMGRVYSAVMGGKASKIDHKELERGRYAEGGLTEDYSEYLNYLEGEDLETMKSYISTFSDSKIEDGIKIEQAIKKLTRKYRTVVDDIVEIQTLEEKRKKVLDFIKDSANNTKLIIAFSGGKDSVAMVLRAIYEWKIPKTQIELWHHEVDGFGENLFDWKCTPSYCRAFAKEMGVPILFSYSDGGILKEMYRENDWRQPVYFQAKEGGEFIEVLPERKEDQRSTRRMFPAVGSNLETRWCSSVAKIEVMGKAITNNPEYKTANMVIMTGERREESGNRAKYNEIERYRNATKTRNAITWRSIIDMTESEIWDLYKQHKIQPHPCYELGWGRCSCQLCIFSEKDTWASINELTPSKVERIVEIEKDFGHTLYNEFDKIPFSPPQFYKEGDKAGQEKMKRGEKLANVYEAKVVKGKSFIPKDILQRWSKEALGEFVSPIIVEGEWKLPYGAFSQEQSGAN
jgi:3'-phosphoadenosine 5'-phosphosulfate sulfotransferase (PAPS reductase)/FAD synthetase